MNETEIPRHIIERSERRWAEKLKTKRGVGRNRGRSGQQLLVRSKRMSRLSEADPARVRLLTLQH